MNIRIPAGGIILFPKKMADKRETLLLITWYIFYIFISELAVGTESSSYQIHRLHIYSSMNIEYGTGILLR